MKNLRTLLAGAAAMAAVSAGAVSVNVATAPPALAWEPPKTDVATNCLSDGSRLVQWLATNREAAFPRSPAHIVGPVVTPALPTSPFAPAVLQNTGHDQATASTTLPPGFAGTVTFTYHMVWGGPDGGDDRPGGATVAVAACPAPTTTTSTTSTTSTTTSTTVPRSTTTSTLPRTSSTQTTTVQVSQAHVPPVDPTPPAVPVQATPRNLAG